MFRGREKNHSWLYKFNFNYILNALGTFHTHTQEDKAQSVPESLESRKPLKSYLKQAGQIL